MSSNDIYTRLVDNRVLTKTGKLNGPGIGRLPQSLIDEVLEYTSYLDCMSPPLKIRIKAILLGMPEIQKCQVCDNNSALHTDVSQTIFRRFCSCECASVFAHSDNESISKRKLVQGSPEYKRKISAAAQKGRESQIKKYGGFGFQVDSIQENAQLNNQIAKNRKRSKYRNVNIGGRDFIIQGYEQAFLLLKENDEVFSMITSNRKDVPTIKYFNTTKEKLCRYYPDFYIKNSNKVIEVKSFYTLVNGFENVVDKIKATVEQGYEIELHLFRSASSSEGFNIVLHKEMYHDVESLLLELLNKYKQSHPGDCKGLGGAIHKKIDNLLSIL